MNKTVEIADLIFDDIKLMCDAAMAEHGTLKKVPMDDLRPILIKHLSKLLGPSDRSVCVLQSWVCELTMMQQSVLITACRGPDGLHKNHIAKKLLRWLRRSFMWSALDRKVFDNPYSEGGGSFTGPLKDMTTDEALNIYLKCVDEIPHHFHLHFMHAAEILGYKHPVTLVRQWWNHCYRRIVNDAHLNIETEEVMDKRLGDNRDDWLAAEEVTVD